MLMNQVTEVVQRFAGCRHEYLHIDGEEAHLKAVQYAHNPGGPGLPPVLKI